MPLSTITEARDAILTKFETDWGAQGGTIPPIVYSDKRNEIPKNADSWARITVLHGPGGGQQTMAESGSRTFNRIGTVVVQIFTKSNEGLVSNDVLTKVAIDAFEGEKAGSADEVWFRNVYSQEIGNNGDWFQTNVFAEFLYDEVK